MSTRLHICPAVVEAACALMTISRGGRPFELPRPPIAQPINEDTTPPTAGNCNNEMFPLITVPYDSQSGPSVSVKPKLDQSPTHLNGVVQKKVIRLDDYPLRVTSAPVRSSLATPACTNTLKTSHNINASSNQKSQVIRKMAISDDSDEQSPRNVNSQIMEAVDTMCTDMMSTEPENPGTPKWGNEFQSLMSILYWNSLVGRTHNDQNQVLPVVENVPTPHRDEGIDHDKHLEEPQQEVALKESNKNMIPIGAGNARVPESLIGVLDKLKWGSHTYCTRKLLTAIFSRKMLATHSLTGKSSPAFPNKPAKRRLDPLLVGDIIQTVVRKCGVSEREVRLSITTKLADECKMLRIREKDLKKSKGPKQKSVPKPRKSCENRRRVTSSDEDWSPLRC